MADRTEEGSVPRGLELLERLAARDVIVVGSMARWLAGDDVTPHDLDLVIPRVTEVQHNLVSALVQLSARVVSGTRSRPLTHALRLPWDTHWRAETPWGPVDLFGVLPDGSDHRALMPHAIGIALPSGRGVACVPRVPGT